MSRKMLITLIVLMAIVLSGLILVQSRMIKTASDIREEQFDKLVRSALFRVAEQLELNERRIARRSAQIGQLPGLNKPSDKFSNFPRNGINPGSVTLQFSYTESNGLANFREELQIQYRDTSVVKKDTLSGLLQETQSTFAQLFQNLELQQQRERWLSNTDWGNYKVLLEDYPIKEPMALNWITSMQLKIRKKDAIPLLLEIKITMK